MKFWEAMKCLEEGKKVRVKYWSNNGYIMMNSSGYIIDEKGRIVNINNTEDEWELYDDRKECSECYKELYRAVMKVFDVDEGDDGLFDEFDVDMTGSNSLGNMYVILNDLNKEYKLDK